MARILLVAASYPPRIGGYERQVQATCALLRGLGHDVSVAACVDGNASTEVAFPVRARFLLGGSFPVPARGALQDVVASGATRWDLVITNTRFFLPTLQAARQAFRAGIPYVHVEHGGGPLRGRSRLVDAAAALFDRSLGRWIVRHAAATVGVSNAASAFLRTLGAEHPQTIGNVVPFLSGDAVRARLASARPSQSGALLVSVGRLVPNKGLLDLIDAVAAMPGPRRPRLRFVGAGPQRQDLARTAKARGVDLELPGAVPPDLVQKELQSATLACQPSLEEGFGLALLEAIAAGVPVVASDCTAHRELLDAGRFGLLHRAGDPQDLRRALEEALGDPEACRRRSLLAHAELGRRYGEANARAAWRQLLRQRGLESAPDKPK